MNAPVAIVGSADGWAGYHAEVLAHAGISYDVIEPDDLAERLAGYRVVIVLSAVPAGVFDGWDGALVICGDPGELAGAAGVRSVGPVDTGLVMVDPAPVWGDDPPSRLRAFGGVRLEPIDAKPLARWENGEAAITVNGRVVTFGVDLWQSIVRIQQGWPVTGDGRPAPDGTAPIDDDILKCEDGLALSYVDRAVAPGGSFGEPFEHVYPPAGAAPFFDRPHADLWRFLFLRALVWVADQVDQPLPMLFYWPAGISAVAHMSHDSDGNTDEAGRAALSAFAAADVVVTWCVLHPGGYSPEIYADIAAAGHEIALHYNAMGDTDLDKWGYEYLRTQHEWLLKTTGIDRIVSNKNHYTRWEGFDEFYLWCERLGIHTDQSRGPSKQGTVGFTFGTAHPHFPVTWDGRPVDVLELPLHTQDLWWTAVVPDRDVILKQALNVHGVAHFLFHGRNMVAHPEIAPVVVETAAAARELGMPWWTSERINDWERRRRGVRIEVRAESELIVTSAAAISQAVILLPGGTESPDAELRPVAGHGREFAGLVADLPAGRSVFRLTSRKGFLREGMPR